MSFENEHKITLLILAGGLGSRYKGQKQTDSISQHGETLMEFALHDARKAGIRKFVFVLNPQCPIEYKRKLKMWGLLNESEVVFVEQKVNSYIPENSLPKLMERKKPLGTAHAVFCAQEVIFEPFITINADDFYGRESFEIAVKKILNKGVTAKKYTMVGFELKNTLSDFGSVSRGLCQIENDFLLSVKEYVKIEKINNEISGFNENGDRRILDENAIVSMNFWCLHPSFFKLIEEDLHTFLQDNNDLSNKEFYLPTVIDKAISKKDISVEVLPTSEKWLGLTYPEDKTHVVQTIAEMRTNGIYPSKL